VDSADLDSDIAGRVVGSLMATESPRRRVHSQGELQLSGAQRQRRATPICDCPIRWPARAWTEHRPAHPWCLCAARMLDRGAGAMILDLLGDRRPASQAYSTFVSGARLGVRL